MPILSLQEENHNHNCHRRHYLTRNQRRVFLFFLKCVIMLLVFSLFLFFLGFAAIVLVHFLVIPNRRCHVNKPPADDESQPFLLPDVSYTAASFPTTSDCAICLDSLEEGDLCRNLPICKHLFHARCVDRWIGKKPTCPVCRTRVDLDPDGLPGLGAGGVDQWKRPWAVDFEQGTSY